ncbi:ABC transporter ATP-binding protein [Rhodococcus rhodnii]|uniref:ABC transporter n=2 Tax=Rhodococcus rhodnii TaxID=38312 RepID=R7WGQ1_9NOCA|nr:ABC transporter ATP-binding protein [Rhodococcus rhodnii]EOM74255.1 ABC transporter [Rhodococcus rhodnii LMG 5362]TXG89594.1 ABC transporter ATP-binding protein [Rhodococcus rhodnii]
MSTSHDVVDVRDLRKTFGSVVALDGLDLGVAQGEVAGFLGPNGAGKSTAIRVLLGMYRADGGTARLFGSDPFADAVALHSRLAYVPGDVSLWPKTTGGEAIDLLLSLRGVDVATSRKKELLEAFELDPTRRTDTYSKGNRQKVALVAALAADVDLLVLDEPTSGLDPLMEATFRRYVRAAAERGTSVLLSSHILSEVEALCDTVTIIRAGKTVQSGTLTELRHLRRSKVTVDLPDGNGVETLRAMHGVHDFDVERTEHGADSVTFHVDGTDVPRVVATIAELDPAGLTIAPPSLEELFLHEYGAHDDEVRS